MTGSYDAFFGIKRNLTLSYDMVRMELGWNLVEQQGHLEDSPSTAIEEVLLRLEMYKEEHGRTSREPAAPGIPALLVGMFAKVTFDRETQTLAELETSISGWEGSV